MLWLLRPAKAILLPLKENPAERIMNQQELAYLNVRATQELQAAQQAPNVAAARPHYGMAAGYLEQAEDLQRRLRSFTQAQESKF